MSGLCADSTDLGAAARVRSRPVILPLMAGEPGRRRERPLAGAVCLLCAIVGLVGVCVSSIIGLAEWIAVEPAAALGAASFMGLRPWEAGMIISFVLLVGGLIGLVVLGRHDRRHSPEDLGEL